MTLHKGHDLTRYNFSPARGTTRMPASWLSCRFTDLLFRQGCLHRRVGIHQSVADVVVGPASSSALIQRASVGPRCLDQNLLRRSMFPINLGWADHISATTPTTCGPAIEVPLLGAKVFLGMDDRTSTPGATISGLTRWLPSTVTGPRLLNGARLPNLSNAPTLKAAS